MWHFNSLKNLPGALCVVAAIGLPGSAALAAPAEPGDPARWYKADRTMQERIATSRKEAYAAYKEAQLECAKLDKRDRAACLAEAKAILQQDLEYAQRQPQAVSLRIEEGSPASLVRRHLALMMLDEGACATK